MSNTSHYTKIGYAQIHLKDVAGVWWTYWGWCLVRLKRVGLA